MRVKYLAGVLIGAAIGLTLSYLYSQGDGAAITSNLWIGALIGALVGLYMVSVVGMSGRGKASGDGCGGESPQFG
ncbi:MAG TPA: hypothetical protein G4O20_08305 [Dehalococcoidia bacterium]|nr:hypothetical protein [Dehalococcoidia bacterium]